MTRHQDVRSEQAYVARAYDHLARMRDRTDKALAATDAATEVDAAIAAAHLDHRRRSLDDVDGLTFGRLDDEDGDTWYVGRRHVEDEGGDPVVVDWRTDVAVPFYRATPADPLDLRRRRRFLMEAREVTDLIDEVFDDPDSVDAAHHGGIPDPLLVELERAREGAMRDIVATIAAEQDEVIRAPLDRCLVVQGGPGTGKTAVGLHRAAFLLYEHRGTLDDAGVLVLGPNPVFLRYISQVLPSLGEYATRQATIERLLGGTGRAAAADPTALARLKGEARMADVLRRALEDRVTPPSDDLTAGTQWGVVRVAAADVAAAVEEIRARGVPYSVGRNALRTQVERMAWQWLVERRGEAAADPDAFVSAVRSDRAWSRALGKVWPTVSGAALVRRVLTQERVLREASDGLLDADERAGLMRRAAPKLDDEPWTVADLVLVDEAEALVSGVPRTYGHVVVDEAQDLSAMELRLVARRCPSGSLTVLGDLAQATAPAAQASWDEVLAHLGAPDAGAYVELDLGYRVPAPVMRFANRLLPVAAPDLPETRSVRETGDEPALVSVLADEVAAAVARAAETAAAVWTSVGVIVPDGLVGAVRDALRAADVAAGDGLRGDAGVTLLEPPAAKGLEFDAVVVAEPAAFGSDPASLRLLYVALTRAVQTLTVVHSAPLPSALR